jgi:hypothetical protein
MYYVGAPLRHRGIGRVLVVSWIMVRVRIWENIMLSVGFPFDSLGGYPQ